VFGKRDIVGRIIVCVALCMAGYACTPATLDEAQQTVAQADSLRAAGRMYDDSLSLARAYEALGHSLLSTLHPSRSTSYAHACYHYGRLLRAKENPVAAMECFIKATHSRTRDHHILGRVYSNMGSICHMAGEYSLSYEMYRLSADMFMRNNDTLSYCFLLNEMAFELAEQGKKEETLELLSRIDYPDQELFSAIYRTKAVLYRNVEQYDSALYYANSALKEFPRESAGLLVKAQVFSILGYKDSAVIYAEEVSLHTQEMHVLNNALYILTNDDEGKDKNAIRQTAAERADVQKILEIRQGKLSQAVQLLEQDLNRKPDWRWIYIVLAIVLFFCSSSILYIIWRKRKQHQQLVMDLRDKETQHIQLENSINDLSLLKESRHIQIIKEAEEECQLLIQSKDIRKELSWNNYEQMCTIVNLRLFGIIDRLHSFSLSEKEIRLCVLVLLQASTEQMVNMIPYAKSGLGKFKYSTARKLGTSTSHMRTFMLNMMG